MEAIGSSEIWKSLCLKIFSESHMWVLTVTWTGMDDQDRPTAFPQVVIIPWEIEEINHCPNTNANFVKCFEGK
jgi:hypothetical protein